MLVPKGFLPTAFYQYMFFFQQAIQPHTPISLSNINHTGLLEPPYVRSLARTSFRCADFESKAAGRPLAAEKTKPCQGKNNKRIRKLPRQRRRALLRRPRHESLWRPRQSASHRFRDICTTEFLERAFVAKGKVVFLVIIGYKSKR